MWPLEGNDVESSTVSKLGWSLSEMIRKDGTLDSAASPANWQQERAIERIMQVVICEFVRR